VFVTNQQKRLNRRGVFVIDEQKAQKLLILSVVDESSKKYFQLTKEVVQ
jgi:hypothetical protein